MHNYRECGTCCCVHAAPQCISSVSVRSTLGGVRRAYTMTLLDQLGVPHAVRLKSYTGYAGTTTILEVRPKRTFKPSSFVNPKLILLEGSEGLPCPRGWGDDVRELRQVPAVFRGNNWAAYKGTISRRWGAAQCAVSDFGCVHVLQMSSVLRMHSANKPGKAVGLCLSVSGVMFLGIDTPEVRSCGTCSLPAPEVPGTSCFGTLAFGLKLQGINTRRFYHRAAPNPRLPPSQMQRPRHEIR